MKMTTRSATLLAAVIYIGHGLAAYTSWNGLAVTPAMGWDNWNAFGCDVDEELLLGTARKMVDYGLRDLGYNYVVLDDCWSNGRMDNGTLQVDLDKFPNGMKHVADQIHDMGMKFGMYSSAGFYTCGWYEGSLGREDVDAKFFADTGVDYLKYDNCYNGGQSGTAKLSYDRYKTMGDALNKTGRPILYSLCNWGEDGPWNWAQTFANQWRMSGDIYDSFNRPDDRCPCENTYDCLLPGFHCSAMNILNKLANIPSKSQSGAFNDLDALEVGNGGMTDSEYVAHMSMWSFVSSPLIMGTDVTKLSPQAYSIYANPAVLALNQDPSASAGNRRWKLDVPDKDEYGQGDIQLWTRMLKSGDVAVAMLNTGTNNRTMEATLADIFFDQSTGGTVGQAKQLSQTWDVYDLWANRMDNEMAAAVMNGSYSSSPSPSNSTTVPSASASSGNSTSIYYTYNATATSYADGLKANHPALMGKKLSTSIPPMGTLTADVPAHAVALFRLRSQGGGDDNADMKKTRRRKRDEL